MSHARNNAQPSGSRGSTSRIMTTATELAEKSLTCEMCKEEFNTEERLPQILPCFHSFCGTCMQSLQKAGTFHCPSCGKAIAFSGPFPVDATLVVLMDMRKCGENGEGIPCQGCSESKTATGRCLQCADFLCEECSSAHRRVKISKDHNVVPLTEVAANPTMFAPAGERCSRHSDKVMDYYCNSCKTLVCAACALDLHKTCSNVVELDNIVDERKKELISCCGQLEALLITFRNRMANTEATQRSLDTHLKEAEGHVEKVYADIAALIAARKGEMLADLRARAMSARCSLDEQHSQLRYLHSEAEATTNYVKRLVALNLGAQILVQKAEIQKVLTDLMQFVTSCAMKVPEYKLITEKMPELKHALKKFGRIESSEECEKCPSGSGKAVKCESTRSVFQNLRISCPVFLLDETRCGLGCTLSGDCCILCNLPCSRCKPVQRCNVFKFKGTCVTTQLPSHMCFWQTHCRINLSTLAQDCCTLAELGVATERALLSGVGVIAPCDDLVVAVCLYNKQGHICAKAHCKKKVVVHVKLVHNASGDPMQVTIGFLLDHIRSRIIVIDVNTTRVLCECPVEKDVPLFPFINMVQTKDVTKADVKVTLQTGQDVQMTQELASVIHSLVFSN